MYRQCVGGLLYHTQDRADTQYEVSILGSMLGKPTQRSMIALKRVTRYLEGTRDFVNKLELDGDVDKHVARLDGFSDSDWAGSTDRKSQSSGVHFVDGARLYSFSRRQSVIATNSGMAEFHAGCATAEEMLLARDVLMFFGCQVEASLHMDRAVARGICRREGVGKVKALEVRTLWLQQVVKAKTLTLKTVESKDSCADFGAKTLAAWKERHGQRSMRSAISYNFFWRISQAQSDSVESVGTNAGRDCKERSDDSLLVLPRCAHESFIKLPITVRGGVLKFTLVVDNDTTLHSCFQSSCFGQV